MSKKAIRAKKEVNEINTRHACMDVIMKKTGKTKILNLAIKNLLNKIFFTLRITFIFVVTIRDIAQGSIIGRILNDRLELSIFKLKK